ISLAARDCACVKGLVVKSQQTAGPSRASGRGLAMMAAASAAHSGHIEPMQSERTLQVRNLSIRFGGLTAIEDMTFDVREGEVLSLIGPNGAGKTSAFNAITGYLPRARGDIFYQPRRLTGLRPNAIAQLGIVRTFQKTSLFGDQSVLDNILIGLHLRSRQRSVAIMLGLPSVTRDERERE